MSTDKSSGDAPAFSIYFIFALFPQVAVRNLQVEVGRGIRELGGLARPYTPYVAPEVLVAADGTQATTTVVQEVLIDATARSRGPPVAIASIVERAIVVEPASNRRKSGYVASTSNTPKFTVSW